MMKNSKNKGRQKFLPLALVSRENVPENVNREQWLDIVCNGFIASSKANKSYYRVLLEELWPQGHGIPGPRVKEEQLREAIDRFRRNKHEENKPYKAYVDVFRRLRELQGDEGVTGIGREGRTFQLVNLDLSQKRILRIKLSDDTWQKILENYRYKCAVCGRSEPDVRFQRDHKIPRTRGGGNELENWQPLCDECNNFKSTSCRGCQLDCKQCSWAFPEQFFPLRLSSKNIIKLRKWAADTNTDPHKLLNQIISEFLQNVSSENTE